VGLLSVTAEDAEDLGADDKLGFSASHRAVVAEGF
jgi:hypothetical protein